MNYEDAASTATSIARKVAGGVFCGLALVMTSLYGGVPDGWVWLGCALAAGTSYFAVSAAMTHYYIVVFAQETGSVALVPEPVLLSPPAPGWGDEDTASAQQHPADVIRAHAPEWAHTVDWHTLSMLVRQPHAPLSRAALDGIVDQRFYSPRDGDSTTPFPELMVIIGAATPIKNGGDRVSYVWSSSASQVMAAVERAFSRSPTPPTA